VDSGRDGIELGEDADERLGVNVHAAEAKRPVQVRSGDAARGSHLADHGSFLDDGALAHVQARQVREQRDEALTMVDDDRVAAEEEVVGKRHASRVGCDDRMPTAPARSRPRWTLWVRPLKVRRTPNVEVTCDATGRPKRPAHSDSGVLDA